MDDQVATIGGGIQFFNDREPVVEPDLAGHALALARDFESEFEFLGAEETGAKSHFDPRSPAGGAGQQDIQVFVELAERG